MFATLNKTTLWGIRLVLGSFFFSHLLLAQEDYLTVYADVNALECADLNGDGYRDIIASAYYSGIMIFWGSPAGYSDTPDVNYIDSFTVSILLGSSLATGDINQDGYDDLVAGAWLWDGDLGNEGALFIFWGSDTGLALNSPFILEGNMANATLGSAVEIADINQDGYLDIIGCADWWTEPY